MTTRNYSGLVDRRALLRSSALLGSALVLGNRASFAQVSVPLLKIDTRTIEVNKKAATVFRVTGPSGRSGITAAEGDRFSGTLLNASGEPLQMHWHGQIDAPFEQDRARPGGGTLASGNTDAHDFPLTPGTHWMHSHSLSEQQLLAAPLVTREKDAGDEQDVVIMLHDFAFRSPQEILAELGGTDAHAGHGSQPAAARPAPGGGSSTMPRGSGMQHGPGMMHGPGGMHGGSGGHMMGMSHANDVNYDAYLANDRTLDDPELVQVEKNSRVRLRIINAGTATAFFITTPGLTSRCVAVDGSPCQPLEAAQYPLAQGQRIDLIVAIPASGGAFPVLAQVEAATHVTGIVVATAGAKVAKIAAIAARPQAAVDLGLEARLRAARPLAPKRADKAFMVMLGEEPGYRWTLNGRIHGKHVPFDVRLGERVEMTFMNPTMMMHPMHLHGHHFQVVAIGGRSMAGAVRDTVMVPGHMPVTIAFDARQKGNWYLHCHHLYHMATGMMTEVRIT